MLKLFARYGGTVFIMRNAIEADRMFRAPEGDGGLDCLPRLAFDIMPHRPPGGLCYAP